MRMPPFERSTEPGQCTCTDSFFLYSYKFSWFCMTEIIMHCTGCQLFFLAWHLR